MIGILLAAGFSRRFDAGNKLLHRLQDGRPMALAAAQHLVQAVPVAIAVVRPDNPALGALLESAGMAVVTCADHERDMAESLAAAVRYSAHYAESADGFVIALADMPFIRPQTIAGVADALRSGAAIVVPAYQGRRGHPVAFAAKFRNELEQLRGDSGARSIIALHADEVLTLACDDAGILTDIDTLSDIP